MRYRITKACGINGVNYVDGDVLGEDIVTPDVLRSLTIHACVEELPEEPQPEGEEPPAGVEGESQPEPPAGVDSKPKRTK